jgi:hypothetical protein
MELGRLHVKIAQERGRRLRRIGIGLIVLAMAGTLPASAQQAVDPRYPLPPPAPRSPNPTNRGSSGKMVDLRTSFTDVPGVKPVAIPVNPSDAIAIVNGQPISRQQLADECVVKDGKKVLEVMINRLLIEQALARQKLTVTAAEIDEEIDGIAQRFGIDRAGWLRTLEKERGISPAQYAREIVYPAIALRKLCSSRVVVTPKDMQEAFESQYGDKLRVRMILVNTQQKAMQIWEQLHANPGAFERVAKDQSMDPGSKSLGGLLADPITRHAYPRNVSDAAFQQLVDGDPRDRDPSHKPKDGDITGPIQAGESAWIMLYREELVPANKNVNPKDKNVMAHTHDLIYEVKLKEVMETFFEELIKAAAVENRLTGSVKMANEGLDPNYKVDEDVKLMGKKPGDDKAPTGAPGATNPTTGPSPTKSPRPVMLAPDADKQFRPLKPGGNPTTPAGSSSTAPQSGTSNTAPPAGGGSQ